MIRDKAIADLLARRLISSDPARREAATILIELCRTGLSDREISAALEKKPVTPTVSREIERLTEELGLAPAER